MTKLTVLLLNAAVVIAGSLIGSNLKKVIRKDVLDGVMIGIGVVTVFIGATGVSTDTNVLTLLIAYSPLGAPSTTSCAGSWWIRLTKGLRRPSFSSQRTGWKMQAKFSLPMR